MAQIKNITQSFGIFLIAVMFYGLFYSLNDALIQHFDELPGANLFRLSSGIKLLLVLLLGWLGSVAIACFCFAWTVLYIFPGSWVLSAEVAIAAGLVPLVVCHRFDYYLMPDLSGLTWQRLFMLSLVYACVNSVVRVGAGRCGSVRVGAAELQLRAACAAIRRCAAAVVVRRGR